MPLNSIKRLRPLSTNKDWGLSHNKIAKSGVLVFRELDHKPEILLLHRKKQDDWTFPKGHVEAGEGPFEAGLRELFEETHVRPMIIGRLPDLEYLDGKGIPVRMALFLGYTEEINHANKMSPEGEVDRWIPLAHVERTLSYENLKSYFIKYVRPLFTQKRFDPEVHTDIFFSKAEPYKNGAELLTQILLENNIPSRRVEMNRLIFRKEDQPAQSICYFLTNHLHAPRAIFWCEQFGGYVVNNEYWRSWHSKSQVQRLLADRGVPVPLSEPFLFSNKKLRSTWMLKSEKHGIKNLQSINVSKHYSWDTYLEQKIDTGQFTEIKLGYVAGCVLTDNPNFYPSSSLISALQRTQEYLGLEVFSVDLFINQKNIFYIIDVNPAPAFFCNAKARQAFAQYIRFVGRFHL